MSKAWKIGRLGVILLRAHFQFMEMICCELMMANKARDRVLMAQKTKDTAYSALDEADKVINE